MTIKKKDTYHHGDLRQQLVNATRLLVEERGPDGFSVSEACRRAGVSTAAPYRHFPDRQAMLTAVAEQAMQELGDQFDAVVADSTAGTTDSITAIGLAYVKYATENPGVFRLMFGVDEESLERKHVKQSGTRCLDVVMHEVARFLGKTEIDEQVRGLMFPLWTFVHGAAFLSIDGKLDKFDMTAQMPGMIAVATVKLLGEIPDTN